MAGGSADTGPGLPTHRAAQAAKAAKAAKANMANVLVERNCLKVMCKPKLPIAFLQCY